MYVLSLYLTYKPNIRLLFDLDFSDPFRSRRMSDTFADPRTRPSRPFSSRLGINPYHTDDANGAGNDRRINVARDDGNDRRINISRDDDNDRRMNMSRDAGDDRRMNITRDDRNPVNAERENGKFQNTQPIVYISSINIKTVTNAPHLSMVDKLSDFINTSLLFNIIYHRITLHLKRLTQKRIGN